MDKMICSIIKANVSDKVEVLIINDGSVDNTADLAMKYEAEYPRMIKLIDKENGGHGSTINKGIELAQGKFFRALDGDDWVNPIALKKLVERLGNIDADMILSNYCKCYEDGRNEVVNFEGLTEGMYTFDEIAPIVQWMRYHTVIYKTNILKEHEIKLDEHCFYVDTEFMLFPLPYVNEIYYFDDYIYCYRLGLTDQSVNPESRKKHIDNSLKVAEHILDIANSGQIAGFSNVKKSYIISGIANHCIWHIISLLLFPTSKKKKYEIMDFEKKVKEKSSDVYSDMQSKGKYSRSIYVLRKTKYIMYPVVSWYQKEKRV